MPVQPARNIPYSDSIEVVRSDKEPTARRTQWPRTARLNSLMRARLEAYAPLSRFRLDMNVQPQVEPRSPEEVPD